MADNSQFGWIKRLVLGGARSPTDKSVFHQLSLIAFFAWVGLGADGLSSSCYGPEEAFQVLHSHMSLGIFVALGTAFTVFVISYSYSQIIELFPTGGGGYLVASKLLSPSVGMVSGCALLIDYVLTISVSIASGADALFSFLPPAFREYKLLFAVAGVFVLTVMNLRGVRETVLPLVPIFLVFLLTHAFAIVYSFMAQVPSMGELAQSTSHDLSQARGELGLVGMFLLILRAYSMGAGTFTGIEAVSNGLPILREPRERTGKRTILYMALSLAFTAGGLMIAYFLHHTTAITDDKGTIVKTANAVLFETITHSWGSAGVGFVLVTLISEGAILFVAAQTGFLGGPRVLANMALDRWLPGRLAVLSDRLVTAYGIVLMGAAALIVMVATKGDIAILVVLYSINVFITFVLSQLGMVRHWWISRSTVRNWLYKLLINGTGLVLTGFILISMIVIKFFEGGWITLLITSGLVVVSLLIRRHYKDTFEVLGRLDPLVKGALAEMSKPLPPQPVQVSGGNTAVLLVSGFNGLGLHSLLSTVRLFGKAFDNYVFLQVGVIDAGNFKGTEEVQELQQHVQSDVNEYVRYMRYNGLYAEAYCSIAVDLMDELSRLSAQIREKYPNAVFFGGQLVFSKDTFTNRLLHNNIVFAVQRRLYLEGIPFVVLPVRV